MSFNLRRSFRLVIIYFVIVILAIFLYGRFKATDLILKGTSLSLYSSLDGLRGILATLVAVHHFVLFKYWFLHGSWGGNESTVIINAGHVSVSLFFMITSFLFTRKIVESKDIQFSKLVINRFFRIHPLFLFSILVIMFIAFILSDKNFSLSTQAANFSIWNVYLASWGNHNFFSFEDTSLINAGVHWTLRYEWLFYLSLPLIAVCILSKKILFRVLVVVLFIYLFESRFIIYFFDFKYLILFLLGALVAVKYEVVKEVYSKLPRVLSSVISVFLVFLIFNLDSEDLFHLNVQYCALIILFSLFVSGESIFGLLVSVSARKVGEISYSIYLMHGIVLFVLFSSFGESYLFKIGSDVLSLPIILIFIFIISSFTYLTIEKPSIALGKSIIRYYKM